MLTRIVDGVWSQDTFLPQPGGVKMPGRMVVVRRPDASLLVWSPVPMDDTVAAEVDALGEVRWLIAPNLLHHLSLGDAVRRWPKAKLLAPPGLAGKRPDLRIDGPIDGLGELRALPLGGMPKLAEVPLIHEPSGSLFLADFVFNIPTAPNWQTSLVLSMVGANGRFAQSRSVRWLFTGDRERLRADTETLLAADFTRIVPAHGEVVAEEAKEKLRSVVSWLG
jgi:hypothetical protein